MSQTASSAQADKRALLAKLLQQREAYNFPLSYGQQALWFIYQNAPESSAYNMAWPIELRGDLDSTALQKALQALVKRHSALRARLEFIDGEPVQTVRPEGACQWHEQAALDWSEQQLYAALRTAYEQAFELSAGPVLRANLFRTGSQRSVLLLSMHHIFGDATSMSILGNELLMLYQAEINGEKAQLPSLSGSFADYVRAEIALLNGPAGEESARYWQRRLENQSPVLELPTDFSRPAIQGYRGASLPFSFSAELNQRIKALAQEERSTLFTLLLTVFQILLQRYSGQTEIWIGTPTSTARRQPEFTGLIGYLVNPVVLRASIEAGTALSFRDLLARNKPSVLEALEHSRHPFAALVKLLHPQRESSHAPLFQVLLDFKPAAAGALHRNIAGLEVMPLDFPQMEGQFDVTLTLSEAELSQEGAPLAGRFNYNPDLFKPETIARMAGHFETLLDAIIADPACPLARLPLLTAQETRQLQAWNETAVDYPRNATLADLFERQVEATPDNLALACGEERWSYRELNAQANRLAHLIRWKLDNERLGTENPLIAICLERSVDMVVGLLAIVKARGAYVPIDPSYPQARIQYMLEDSAAPLLLTWSRLKDQLPVLTHECAVLCLDEVNYAGQPAENPNQPRFAEDLAYVIYTSGSTGKPKGAMNAHSGIVNRLLWMQDAFQLSAEDRALQKTPFSFDVSVWEFFWPLITGAGLVVAKPEGHKDPAYLAETIADHGISVVHFVPSMLKSFLEHADISRCKSLKRVLCSGEALSSELVEQFFALFGAGQTELHNLYGPTEAAVDVSHWPCRVEDAGKPVPIGKPIANTRLYVLDANHQVMPIGVQGELCIAGIQTGLGYLKRPDLTAEKFLQVDVFGKTERIYKTGDLARWRSEGHIEYLGRIDHQVKLRGFRIELGEIEAALLQVPGVKQSAVVIRETGAAHKQLVAYVVTGKAGEEQEGTATQRLKEELQKNLPDYMVPNLFVFLEAMPLSPNGKIDRKALPAPVLRKASYVYPRNAVELRLAKIWERLFNISPLCVLDDFFELGGDSLLAIRLFSAIKDEFGVTLPLHILFQNRSLEQLACILRQEKPVSSEWSPLVCLQAEGSKTPLFFVHASGGSAFNYLQIANLMGAERPFYAIQPRGIEPGEAFHETIEEMAADYVQAVRTIQPKGPYLFAGWSFGGTVIFEMARILEQAGESVPFFIMIDTPEPSATLTKDDDVEFMLDRLPHYHGVKLDELDLQTSKEAQLAYLLKEIKMAGLFAPDIDQAQALNWFNLYKHHNKIIGLHKPTGEIDGRIIFFKPSEKIPFDVQMGNPIERWPPFTRGGMEVHEATGNHFDMVSPANTPELVEKMKDCIKAFDAFELDATRQK